MSHRVYLITPHARPEIVPQVQAALRLVAPGEVAVLLRDRMRPVAAVRGVALALSAALSELGAPLYIHTHADLAREVGAAGLHLPEGHPCAPDLRCAVSRHNRDGLIEAERQGATFACLSPVGVVPGKNPPLGIDGFRRAIEGIRVPTYALGAVGRDDVGPLRDAGACGIAVIRAVFDAPRPAQALRALCHAWAAAS